MRLVATIVTVEARHTSIEATLYDAPGFTVGSFVQGQPKSTIVTRLAATIKK